MRRLPPLAARLCCVAALFVCSHSGTAHAYAWMIKHGLAQCSTCHTDPSGGETLNHVGRTQADQLLSWGGSTRARPEPWHAFLFGAVQEPEPLRLGASYRHMFLYTAAKGGSPSDFSTFPMQLDAYGTARFDVIVVGVSLGVARGIVGSAHVRGAQLNRELGEGWILLSRSHYLGVQLDSHTLLRLGRLNLPFGVRLPEHVLWVREATRTDRESDQQHGLALAYTSGRLRLEAMGIFGNFQTYPDRYRERGYSASAELLLSETSALGVSSLLTRTNEDRFTQAQKAIRYAEGVNARFGLSPEWSLLAEADLLKEGGRELGYAGFGQLDYEPVRGLHLMATGELLDQGRLGNSGRSVGNGKARVGGWLSAACYLFSHLELRWDVVLRQNAALTTQAQLHVFL